MGSDLDNFELRQTIIRTITSSPAIQDANVFIKQDAANKADEEAAPVAVAYNTEDKVEQNILEGMSQEEIAVARKCARYSIMLREGGLTRDEKTKIEEDFEKSSQELLTIKQKYESAGKPFYDTVTRANHVIKNVKSPLYIADEKKRRGLFKSLRYGIDDPFFDGLEEIYGEGGFEWYRKERIGLFKNISDDDVKLASERYKREKSPLIYVKTIAQLAVSAAAFVYTYPAMLETGASPIITGIGYLAIAESIKLPEMHRSVHNYDIFLARIRIAKDLGLIDKDKKSADIEKEKYK